MQLLVGFFNGMLKAIEIVSGELAHVGRDLKITSTSPARSRFTTIGNNHVSVLGAKEILEGLYLRLACGGEVVACEQGCRIKRSHNENVRTWPKYHGRFVLPRLLVTTWLLSFSPRPEFDRLHL